MAHLFDKETAHKEDLQVEKPLLLYRAVEVKYCPEAGS